MQYHIEKLLNITATSCVVIVNEWYAGLRWTFFPIHQVQESNEARQKFSNAKSISSAQFFGDQAKPRDMETQASLQKFSVCMQGLVCLKVSFCRTHVGFNIVRCQHSGKPYIFIRLRDNIHNIMFYKYSIKWMTQNLSG